MPWKVKTMKPRSLLLSSAMAASVLGFAATAHAADVKEVQMLHWWTSGGEAAALNVLKQDLVKEGYAWKDVPVAGGGGAGAMTTLKAMVAAGNPPTASQILGYFALDYAEAGKLGDITALATKEGWDKVVPTALQKFTTTNGKWDAVPVNIHSVNWIWLNKAVMEKIGGTEPKTFDDFVALLDKAKAAGVIPLALGGQPWQEATMFDSVVASTGGIDFYKKAFIDLDAAALKSDTMKKAFDNLAKLRSYTDPNYAGRDWNLATAMVIKGDALVQVMGDWAKGEFRAANKEAGKDFICYRFPGTDGAVIYNTGHVRHLQCARRSQGGTNRHGRCDHEQEFPIRLQRHQGLGAGSHGCAGYGLRHVRQEGHRRRQIRQRQRQVPRIAGAELRPAPGCRRCL